LRVQSFSYSWTISNFRFILKEIRKHIRGPIFSIRAIDKWYKRAHLNISMKKAQIT
ncbi:hypothetical protein HispidOSU_021021, partial [Sigmodon hispidus]